MRGFSDGEDGGETDAHHLQKLADGPLVMVDAVALGDHPLQVDPAPARRLADYGSRHQGARPGRRWLHVHPPLRGLDRPCTEAALKRRQGAQGRERTEMAGRVAGEAPGQGRGSGAGEHDGADHHRASDQER